LPARASAVGSARNENHGTEYTEARKVQSTDAQGLARFGFHTLAIANTAPDDQLITVAVATPSVTSRILIPKPRGFGDRSNRSVKHCGFQHAIAFLSGYSKEVSVAATARTQQSATP
jgi:hypothetical protein